MAPPPGRWASSWPRRTRSSTSPTSTACSTAATRPQRAERTYPTPTLARGENKLGTSEQCARSLTCCERGNEGEAQLVELIKDLGNQAALEPTFTLRTIWEPEPATYPISRITQIDYNDGAGPQPIQWCGGLPGDPTLPAGQLWCLSGQSSAPAGDGQIVVTENFYGAGDPRFLR